VSDAPRSAFEAWTGALVERHMTALTRSEFLRAMRALSARYVEQRHDLATRSPLDSAGKRAAFAVLYGPIHYATTLAIVRGLGLEARPVDRIVDLGCGAGAASAAWASAVSPSPVIEGVDQQAWAVTEAGWTWRTLGVAGRARRGDLLTEAARLSRRGQEPSRIGVLAAWSVNELPLPARAALKDRLLGLGDRGAPVLVIEPLSGRAAPWWDEWTEAFVAAGGRADRWRAPNTLPGALRALDRDAGFDRPDLVARSLLLASRTARHLRATIDL
jgi:hypothetical protein